MNNYQIKIIENKENFDAIFSQFSEASLISKGPDLHFVGFDCEYIDGTNYPESFKSCDKWVLNVSKIAVCKIQIATKDLCLIIDLCKFDGVLPDQLITILKSESWIKCGVGISNDMAYISENYLLGQCNGAYDMKILAVLAKIESPNLEQIYSKMYNTDYEKVKRFSTSDWSKDMTIDMVKYASEDAYISYMIGSKFFHTLKVSLMNTFYTNENMVKQTPNINVDVNKNNWIGKIQEHCQKNKLCLPEYKSVTNTNHEYAFAIECNIDALIVRGHGNTKQDAKQDAANNMYKQMHIS
jgi:hypothetical protein